METAARSRPDALLETLSERLRDAVARRYGASARVENVAVATLGGSNRTLLFDLVDGAARRRLVFRQETYGLPMSPFIAPERQFQLLRLVHGAGLPVPEPIFECDARDGLERAHVVAFVPGETLPRRLLDAPEFARARARFAAEAGEFLGRLHAIAPARAAFLADTPDSRDPLAAQLARLDHYAEAHPVIELGARWLERHRPAPGDPVLLHGDFRTGNMLLGHDGIRAVLDWECAHLGAPMEDLAWLCLRSFRFGHVDRPVGGFGQHADFHAAYAAASGRRVDREALRWWTVFGFVRWAVLNVMQVHGHLSGARRSPAFAACGRNACLIEYEMLMTLLGHYT